MKERHCALRAKTLVHAFVTTRIDYCNSVLAGAPRSATDKLQRVLNAAARLVSGTRKFDRESIPGRFATWMVRHLDVLHIWKFR